MKIAVFTIVHNESIFLPIWIKHYSKWFKKQDIFVLNHDSSDGSFDNLQEYNVINISNKFSFDHHWMKNKVEEFQKELLKTYDYVIFAESDELIFHLEKELPDYIKTINKEEACFGYEIVHNYKEEENIDLKNGFLKQRKYGSVNTMYSKLLIAKKPYEWTLGFHRVFDLEYEVNKKLILLHLKWLDFNLYYARSNNRLNLPFSVYDLQNQWGINNSLTTEEEIKKVWPITTQLIPEEIKKYEI